jgi:RimJ/RimL family protein N-acetyltransferase
MPIARGERVSYTQQMLYMAPPEWSVPVIETPRLRLRAHTLADYENYCAMWADPVVTQFILGKPSTREETWARMLRHAGHWSMLGFGSWLIEEKMTGDLVGEVGLFDYHRDLNPPIATPEVGWILSPAKHGKGYATEAVLAIIEWGGRHFAENELTAIIAPENEASLNVARKCGFVPVETVLYRASPVVVCVRTFRA